MQQPNQIFSPSLVKMRRNRAADGFEPFLKVELAERLVDRLQDMARDFPLALDVGCHTGQLAGALAGSPKVGQLLQCDLSEKMLRHALGERICATPEWLPFATEKFDLVISVGALHWVNDLPGCLAQIRRILKPDGLFLAILPGAGSLRELRESFAAIEAKHGAIRPHVAPFVEVRDAGNLLTRAGFALPVADSEMLTLTYDHPLKLLRDLKAMGETNHLQQQEKGVLPRQLIPEMCEYYAQHYAQADGRIPASIELITLTAWAPHASQQQPARRGSGKVNLGEILS